MRPTLSAVPPLPVDEVLPDVRSALWAGTSLVLVAPPGAGKTTRVPLALLDEPWARGGRIIVLEPRRIAARAAATHMTRLLGEGSVGGTVGYRTRLDTRVSRSTRVEIVTEGVLIRMLQSDPGLDGVAAVIFDEFHERSLPADLGLALTLHARELFRPNLRVVVMSATLEAEPVAALLGGAPVVRSEGRIFEVETRFLESSSGRGRDPWAIARSSASAVEAALRDASGDVLVFLPGWGEIRRTAEALAEAALPPDVAVLSLHGRMDRREQDRALAPSGDGQRKVVLSTAVAETSLTIEGVRVVVDAGWMRVPRFDAGSGLTRLDTVRVTRDAADQRRGRAGRTGPGLCVRLWSTHEDRGLVATRAPEIEEADLAPLLLDLGTFGAEPDELRWLDRPPAASLAQAREVLVDLELLEPDGAITPLGRDVASLGVHPRLGRMLAMGREWGCARTACDLAAILSEGDPIRTAGRAPPCDLSLRIEAVSHARRRGAPRGALAGIVKESDRLMARLLAGGAGQPSAAGATEGVREDATGGSVGRLAASAFPDRVALRRANRTGHFLLRNGRGASVFADDPFVATESLVAVRLDGSAADARIYLAAAVTGDMIDELFGHQMSVVDEVRWHGPSERVRARRVRRLGALTVQAAPLADPSPWAVAGALCDGIRAEGLGVLPWTPELRQLQHRIEFLRSLDASGWPPTSDEDLLEGLEDWLQPYLAGLRSLGDLKRVDLGAALRGRVEGHSSSRLDVLAPSHLEVPSGSRRRIDYSDSSAPTVSVRLQEVFGLSETPRIGGGAVPLTLHLLSPASRPVQVTQDLASFWKGAYFEVRKDLRGRYPKHAWPEDPLNAQPLRGVPRRRG